MVKNLKVLTSIFGFLEAAIYIFGLAIVLSGDQSIIEMVVYALGFSLGLVAGIWVEQKLAIGYSSFEININHKNAEMVKELRDRGFGVTVYMGEGRNGERVRLDILTKRKREAELIEKITAYEPNAFIISYEPKMFKGGYLKDIMKKRMSLRKKLHQKAIPKSVNVIEKTIGEIKTELNSFRKQWKG